MRAVLLREFGPPGNLRAEEVPTPTPGPGQLLVDVAAAGITFVETQLRAGAGPFRWPLPVIPGNGVGGVVASVGADVDPSLVGVPVVSSCGGTGGYAEQTAVAAVDAIVVPDGVELTDAVALLADGRTATGLIRATAPQPGEWVLVEAAGGGVGSLLVQLAHAAGARVVAAASGAAKLALASSLGAESTVDYTRPGWADQVREVTGGIDLAFDGVGGEIGRTAFELLRPGGRMCVMGMASGAMTAPDEDEAKRRGVRVIPLGSVFADQSQLRALSESALAAAAAGTLRPTIGQHFPLEKAADAHAAIEARTTLGKTLLIP